jgi:tetratricopeptide (TPR) repeat protein
MTEGLGTSRILTLIFTDLADSTALKTQRGDHAIGDLITRHRAHVRRLAADSGGRIIDWAGDGCFLTFETPSAAVLFALRLQQVHHEEPDLPGVRTGIHMGEVSERAGPDGDAAHPRLEDPQNGLDSARKAVDLNPSMPDAWNWLSWAQLMAGDAQSAIVSSERVQRLDPQGPNASLTNDNLANAYWELGRYEAGLEASRRLLAARPDYYPGHVDAAFNYASLGRIDEARAAIAAARHLQPDLSIETIQRLYGVARPAVDTRRNAALRQAGLE